MKLSNEARLGIVIFLASIIFVAGIVYLKGIDLKKEEYSLTIFYDNVNGLTEGSPLTIAGLAIGKVESMRLAGTSIAVDVSIQNKVRLSRDSKAYIKSASIMGGKLIAISPGIQPETFQDSDTLVGSYEADLTELTSTLAPISSNVLGILERFNTTFDERTRRNIQDILDNAHSTTTEFNTVAQTVNRLVQAEGEKLDYAIDNFQDFSVNISRFAQRLDTIAVSQRINLDTSLYNIRQVTNTLFQTSQNLRSTARSLENMLIKVERGEGSLGKLIKDEKLYNDVDSVAVNLHLLLKDFRENPGRFVKLSIF